MQHKCRQSKIEEDDPNSEAPLFYLNMQVQPIPEDGGKSNVEADRLVAPVRMEAEIPAGCEVEIACLTFQRRVYRRSRQVPR